MATHPLLKGLEKSPSRATEHEGWTMEAEGGESGSIGIRADRFRLRRDRPAERDATTLGKQLARRAGYLLEPLTVVEGNEERALVRSSEPESVDGGADYYEMWVSPDELTVERYHGEAGKRRSRRPVSLTWEQAERFVKDVEAVYEEPDPG